MQQELALSLNSDARVKCDCSSNLENQRDFLNQQLLRYLNARKLYTSLQLKK